MATFGYKDHQKVASLPPLARRAGGMGAGIWCQGRGEQGQGAIYRGDQSHIAAIIRHHRQVSGLAANHREEWDSASPGPGLGHLLLFRVENNGLYCKTLLQIKLNWWKSQ